MIVEIFSLKVSTQNLHYTAIYSISLFLLDINPISRLMLNGNWMIQSKF